MTAEADGWMKLTRAAAVLGISPKTLRLAADAPSRSCKASCRPCPQSPIHPQQDNEIDSQIYL